MGTWPHNEGMTLTKDGYDVDTVGPIQWSTLKMKVKEAFSRPTR
jgi:hypothetical protein